MRIVNLASGSKGNATFVEYGGTKLLIDVGIGVRELALRLGEIGEKLSDINAALVTHEHSDHIRALETLAKKYDMEFYIESELAGAEVMRSIPFKDGKLKKITLDKFAVGEIECQPFPVSHDAIFPVGYVLSALNSRSKAAFLTDSGTVTEAMKRAVTGAKIIFLESNYDEEMLLGGGYPYPLKRRILSEHGHLSNAQSLELAKFLYTTGTRCFVLSHLSENNNTKELAYLNFAESFEGDGLSLDKDVFIRLSYQNKHGSNFILKEEFDGNDY